MTFDFRAVVAAAEERIVAGCRLVPAQIPPDLARAEGTLRGEPVVIETRGFVGRPGSSVQYARFVSMRQRDGGVDVGNVLCVPHARFGLPILGADLVALTPRSAMVAADLSPTLPRGPRRDAQLDLVARARASARALPPGGELPRYCADFFSPHHLYTRFGPEDRDAACSAFLALVDAFVALSSRCTATSDAVEIESVTATQRAYADAHVSDEKGLEVLARAFGRPWAVRYVHEVMFPRVAPGAAATRHVSEEEVSSP